jgi:hypothetical protein
MKAKKPVFLLALAFLLCGCNLPFARDTSNNAAPLNSNLSKPTLVPTAQPTATSVLSTAMCTRDGVIAELKHSAQYDEFSPSYYTYEGKNVLALWFVDPDIRFIEGQNTDDYSIIALTDAVNLVHYVSIGNSCIKMLFDDVNPIVVDSDYNGWLATVIHTYTLPTNTTLTQEQFDDIYQQASVYYLRRDDPSPRVQPPEDRCAWSDAQSNVLRHFNSTVLNQFYYLVQDENGIHAYVQIEDFTTGLSDKVWYANLIATILNITSELKCVYPTPTDLLLQVVDPDGKIEMIGRLPDPLQVLQTYDFSGFVVAVDDRAQ